MHIEGFLGIVAIIFFFGALPVNLFIAIYTKLIDRTGRYTTIEFSDIVMIFIAGLIPAMNIAVMSELIIDMKYTIINIKREKSRTQKINTIEELPVKLDQESIDNFDKIVVLATLTDEYKVESAFKEYWKTKEHGKINQMEYVFTKKNSKIVHNVICIFDSKTNILKECRLKSKYKSNVVCELTSDSFDDAISILERRII